MRLDFKQAELNSNAMQTRSSDEFVCLFARLSVRLSIKRDL